jgi:hypothetical protein
MKANKLKKHIQIRKYFYKRPGLNLTKRYNKRKGKVSTLFIATKPN